MRAAQHDDDDDDDDKDMIVNDRSQFNRIW